jgi:hypothetical protein
MTWDDRNDSYFVSEYKRRKQLKTVLALCFSEAVETYHHWHVFSKGPAGVCVVFDYNLLNTSLKGANLCTKPVEYKKIREIKANPVRFKVDELPFIKRFGFEPEREIRVLYESNTENKSYFDVEIELECIQKIVLSPWMHSSVFESTKTVIRKIKGCENIKISHSTLTSSERWKGYGENAVD